MSTFSSLCLVLWTTSFILVGVRGETLSLGSGVHDMPWGVGAIKEGPIPGDAEG